MGRGPTHFVHIFLLLRAGAGVSGGVGVGPPDTRSFYKTIAHLNMQAAICVLASRKITNQRNYGHKLYTICGNQVLARSFLCENRTLSRFSWRNPVKNASALLLTLARHSKKPQLFDQYG